MYRGKKISTEIHFFTVVFNRTDEPLTKLWHCLSSRKADDLPLREAGDAEDIVEKKHLGETQDGKFKGQSIGLASTLRR